MFEWAMPGAFRRRSGGTTRFETDAGRPRWNPAFGGARFGLSFVAAIVLSCKTASPPSETLGTQPSPQANVVPAPLANVPLALPSAKPALAPGLDAGPPPIALRPDESSPADTLTRDSAGYSLLATLHMSELASSPRAPDVNVPALEIARRRGEPRLSIDLSPSRIRIAFVGSGFPLPSGAELRARVDRYGHLLVIPADGVYAVVAPGALRATLGERRLDVAPLAPAELTALGEGPKRFAYRTRRVDVATRAARASFEIAHVPETGDGGVLLCRALLDLMNAPPSTPLCGSDELPMRAELRWTTRGVLTFDAVQITRRSDLAAQQLAVPPAGVTFTVSPFSHDTSQLLVSRADLGSFRLGSSDPPRGDSDGDLLLINASDQLHFVWLDGVAAAWIAPGARLAMGGLHRGRYALQWRTSLGDGVEPPESVGVPGVATYRSTDAGAAGR